MTSSTVSSVAPVPMDATNKGSVTVAAIILGSSGKSGDFTADVGAKVSVSPMTGSGPAGYTTNVVAVYCTAKSMIANTADAN